MATFARIGTAFLGSVLALSLIGNVAFGASSETADSNNSTASCSLSDQTCTDAEASQFCTRFIDEKLAVWQQRLKLTEWHVSVNMTRRADLKPKTLGGLRWDKKKKSAVMAVLDPADYHVPFNEMLDDMEFTIVHELVHLQLASLPRSEASRSNEEHAVNAIADALLALDRAH